MASEGGLLLLANTLGEGLRQPHAPTACPGCIAIYSGELKPDSSTTLLVQTKCHAFLNALMAFVSAGWTPEQQATASSMFRRSHFRCRRCNPTRKTLEEAGITSSVFDFVCHAIIQSLMFCLSGRVGRRDKGFGSKRGRWPTSAEQLFPGGPERTMGALVDLLERNNEVSAIIVDLVTAHRPLAFSALLTPDIRARVIGIVISRAKASLRAAQADMSKLRQPILPPVRDAIAQRHIKTCHLDVLMLYIFCFGPDSKMLDKVHFMYHREGDLFEVLDPLMRLLEDPERTHEFVTILTGYLWHATPEPRRERLGCLEVPPYAQSLTSEGHTMIKDPYLALRHYLGQRAMQRDCKGPNCGKRVHDKSTPGAFSLCAKCRAVQYCSKECQKADWSDKTFPHKEICDMLQELFTFARMDVDREQFADACRAHAFPLERVDRIIEWATNGLESHDYAHGAPFLHRSLEPGMTAGELFGIDPADYESGVMMQVVPNDSNRRTPLTQAEIAEGLAEIMQQIKTGNIQEPDFSAMQRSK